ncbi:prepilin-type N-terminal cleavage/methylation domain-containing protein [Metabacillus sp. GX 13764]|uniref:PilW family protein n=1 Tax=Metabacillus kandeliae TaxID=2900151 RepID=UPI001E3A2240|nr:prepilin-type N-terminal cleavage/methylation domain-containing protein [Metabacillus kandeliae]
MRKSAEAFRDERGLTLIELLAALAVSSIVMIIFYNVFMMGVKTFEKTGVEGQLRDEADYVVSNILSELYQSSTDLVSDCTNDEKAFCIKITSNKQLQKNEKQQIIQEKVETDNSKIRTVKFIFRSSQIIKSIKEPGQTAETQTVLSDSPFTFPNTNIDPIVNKEPALTLECYRGNNNQCLAGSILIDLKIGNSHYTEGTAIPVDALKFNSRIGF